MFREIEITLMKFLLELLEVGSHYFGYILLAVMGGFINYIGRLREGSIKSWNFISLVVDLATSGFAGLLVALLGIHFKLSIEMICFLAGISGHLGARTISLLQNIALSRLNSLASTKDKSDK